MQTGIVYRNLAVVQEKTYSYLTRFKNVAFDANFFTHYVVCLRAPTILDPPLMLHVLHLLCLCVQI